MTFRNDDREIMQPIRTTSRPPARIKKGTNLSNSASNYVPN